MNLVLAAGHRHVERARDLDVAVDVLGRDRLLEPLDVELLELAADADRLRHRQAVVGVDHQPDVGADRLAHRGDAADVELRIEPRPIFILIAVKPSVDVALRLLDGLLDQPVHVDEVEAGRVARDLGAEGAADQLVDRLVAGLADDVPQRDVDAADAPTIAMPLRAVVLDAVVEVFPDHLDVERDRGR